MIKNDDYVDISGIDKAELLAALFNRSQPVGLGILQSHIQGSHDMTVDEARQLISGERKADNDYGFNVQRDNDGNVVTFDYVRGRPIKVNLGGDTVYAPGYDMDNGGTGTLALIVDRIRARGNLA